MALSVRGEWPSSGGLTRSSLRRFSGFRSGLQAPSVKRGCLMVISDASDVAFRGSASGLGRGGMQAPTCPCVAVRARVALSCKVRASLPFSVPVLR